VLTVNASSLVREPGVRRVKLSCRRGIWSPLS